MPISVDRHTLNVGEVTRFVTGKKNCDGGTEVEGLGFATGRNAPGEGAGGATGWIDGSGPTGKKADAIGAEGGVANGNALGSVMVGCAATCCQQGGLGGHNIHRGLPGPFCRLTCWV